MKTGRMVQKYFLSASASSPCRRKDQGERRQEAFALLIVLVLIAILVTAVAGFVFSTRIEMQLASNADEESELRWLGISAVELSKYVLAESLRTPAGRHTSLNQIWAGGPGEPTETNGPLGSIRLQNVPCGGGQFSIRLIDLERFANINRADPILLQKAFELLGTDVRTTSVAVDSILDWLDPDDNPRMNGAESDYYESLPHPYMAKNGPIDDIGELTLIQGITPELVWGTTRPGEATSPGSLPYDPFAPDQPHSLGLADLFTCTSSGLININTASVSVLQLLPGMDEASARLIVETRAGPDGIDGTEDDTPFTSQAMLNPAVIPGLPPPEVMRAWLPFITVQSRTFEMIAEVTLGRVHRRYHAILVRLNPLTVEVTSFWWD